MNQTENFGNIMMKHLKILLSGAGIVACVVLVVGVVATFMYVVVAVGIKLSHYHPRIALGIGIVAVFYAAGQVFKKHE